MGKEVLGKKKFFSWINIFGEEKLFGGKVLWWKKGFWWKKFCGKKQKKCGEKCFLLNKFFVVGTSFFCDFFVVEIFLDEKIFGKNSFLGENVFCRHYCHYRHYCHIGR